MVDNKSICILLLSKEHIYTELVKVALLHECELVIVTSNRICSKITKEEKNDRFFAQIFLVVKHWSESVFLRIQCSYSYAYFSPQTHRCHIVGLRY